MTKNNKVGTIDGLEVRMNNDNNRLDSKEVEILDIETMATTSSSEVDEIREETVVVDVNPKQFDSPRENDNSVAVAAPPPKESFCVKHCSPCRIIILVLVISAAVTVGTTFGLTSSSDEMTENDFDFFDPNTWTWVDPSTWAWLPKWLDDNPHGGDSPYDFNVWDTGNNKRCRGLTLDIVDNLDPKWDSYFQQSIEDWENGSPDVLTFRVRKAQYHDPECESMLNVMKVCNGDYGATDYVGINIVGIRWNYIVSSIAMMNDHYLDHMSTYAKQNTMCHELGHGLGLGHWDENFYNRDLGNCMDYTAKHVNNQRPATTNFLFLEQMYGNVDGTSLYIPDPSAVKNGTVTEGLHCTSSSSSKSEIFKKMRRRLDGKKRTLDNITEDEFSRYAKMFMSELPPRAVSRELGEEHPLAHLGWRYLKRTEREEVHELDLGNGIRMQSYMKLARRES